MFEEDPDLLAGDNLDRLRGRGPYSAMSERFRLTATTTTTDTETNEPAFHTRTQEGTHMSKNKKNTVKNAIDKNRKYDMDLLRAAGFDDVASALAALDSTTDELRAVEKDYDELLTKFIDTTDRLIRGDKVIVAMAHELHELKNKNKP